MPSETRTAGEPPPRPSAASETRRLYAGDRSGQRDRALLLLLATGLSRTAVIGQ